MAKRTKELTPELLEKTDRGLIKKGGVHREFRVNKNVPRFDFRKKKIPLKEAQRRKQTIIEDLQEQLRLARKAPLETHEMVYVELKRGSKAYKKAAYEGIRGAPMFGFITSKEVSDAITRDYGKGKKKSMK